VPDLADEQPGEQRARYRPETEVLELESAEQVAEADRQVQRQVRIAVEEVSEPAHRLLVTSS
jgi:hypothetical protein